MNIDELNTIFAPDYKILEEVGTGGMATVFTALQYSLNRVIALKIVSPRFTADHEFVVRFRQEALDSARLSHPNIITIYDTGERQGYHFMSMEYLPNGSLRQRIRENGPFTIDRAIGIINALCDGLYYAHSQGLVHRDIKSSNIMFDVNDNPVLMDFGIAKSMESSGLTVQGSFIGTLEYASPEQIESSDRIDHRADIYSMGVVAYEMIRGNVPFLGSTTTLINQVIHKDPEPPLMMNNKQTSTANAIILKALAKDKSQRYTDAMEMKNAFSSLLYPSEVKPAENKAKQTPAEKKQPRFKSKTSPARILTMLLILLLLLIGTASAFYFIDFSDHSPSEAAISAPPVSAHRAKPSETKTKPARVADYSKYGIKLSEVRGGKFLMGSDNGDKDEKPVHPVKVSDFRMSQTEITEDTWDKVMTGRGNGSALPKTGVSYHEIENFLQKLNSATGMTFRLPTEAEWEYAAKEGIYGNRGITPVYSGAIDPTKVAWFNGNSGGRVHPVGKMQPNNLYLYDMCGNVWEMCSDPYDAAAYQNGRAQQTGKRVLRGGGYNDSKLDIRVTKRGSIKDENNRSDVGFRIINSN